MPSASAKPRPRRHKGSAAVGQEHHRSCYFCNEKIEDIDFASVTVLRRMMSDKGKIRGRRVTGNCRRHQNQVGVAVKRAREMALLPLANS
ncbi:MAG: 30S ribosomal protein S18 [Thermoleophilia bacterium]